MWDLSGWRRRRCFGASCTVAFLLVGDVRVLHLCVLLFLRREARCELSVRRRSEPDGAASSSTSILRGAESARVATTLPSSPDEIQLSSGRASNVGVAM